MLSRELNNKADARSGSAREACAIEGATELRQRFE
jgi:hypothetical protein